jgi:hypothetical protein
LISRVTKEEARLRMMRWTRRTRREGAMEVTTTPFS